MRLLHRLQRQSGRNCTKRPCAGSTFATKTHKIRIILHMDTKPWKTQSLEHTLWTDSGRARAPSLPPLRLKGLATARATKQRRLEPDLHPVHTWASSRAPTGAPGHRLGSGSGISQAPGTWHLCPCSCTGSSSPKHLTTTVVRPIYRSHNKFGVRTPQPLPPSATRRTHRWLTRGKGRGIRASDWALIPSRRHPIRGRRLGEKNIVIGWEQKEMIFKYINVY
jgi:hypothetical protein